MEKNNFKLIRKILLSKKSSMENSKSDLPQFFSGSPENIKNVGMSVSSTTRSVQETKTNQLELTEKHSNISNVEGVNKQKIRIARVLEIKGAPLRELHRTQSTNSPSSGLKKTYNKKTKLFVNKIYTNNLYTNSIVRRYYPTSVQKTPVTSILSQTSQSSESTLSFNSRNAVSLENLSPSKFVHFASLNQKISIKPSKNNVNLTFLKGKTESLLNKDSNNLKLVTEHKTLFAQSYSKMSEINLITISLASANRIRQWAEKILPNGKVIGEVINPETVHYKTLKPIKGGLFCERIFGPLKDHECACGKKFNIKNFLTTNPTKTTNSTALVKRYFCRICDVEYTYSLIRRTQLGYIQLASPTTHVWFVKGIPSYISILLDMKKKHLQNVIYNSAVLTLEHSFKGRQYLPTTPSSIFESWQKIMQLQYPEKYGPMKETSLDKKGTTLVRKKTPLLATSTRQQTPLMTDQNVKSSKFRKKDLEEHQLVTTDGQIRGHSENPVNQRNQSAPFEQSVNRFNKLETRKKVKEFKKLNVELYKKNKKNYYLRTKFSNQHSFLANSTTSARPKTEQYLTIPFNNSNQFILRARSTDSLPFRFAQSTSQTNIFSAMKGLVVEQKARFKIYKTTALRSISLTKFGWFLLTKLFVKNIFNSNLKQPVYNVDTNLWLPEKGTMKKFSWSQRDKHYYKSKQNDWDCFINLIFQNSQQVLLFKSGKLKNNLTSSIKLKSKALPLPLYLLHLSIHSFNNWNKTHLNYVAKKEPLTQLLTLYPNAFSEKFYSSNSCLSSYFLQTSLYKMDKILKKLHKTRISREANSKQLLLVLFKKLSIKGLTSPSLPQKDVNKASEINQKIWSKLVKLNISDFALLNQITKYHAQRGLNVEKCGTRTDLHYVQIEKDTTKIALLLVMNNVAQLSKSAVNLIKANSYLKNFSKTLRRKLVQRLSVFHYFSFYQSKIGFAYHPSSEKLKQYKLLSTWFFSLKNQNKPIIIKLYNSLERNFNHPKGVWFTYYFSLKTFINRFNLVLSADANLNQTYPDQYVTISDSSVFCSQSTLESSLLREYSEVPHFTTFNALTFKNLLSENKVLITNNIYCLSHREVWEQEKDWQDFAYYYYSPTNITDKPIPLYQHRNYDLLFNLDNNLSYKGNDYFATNKQFYSLGMNINTAFSGAGLIHKLLNEFNYGELKKMDKQNRILLFEYNKQIKTLKKMMNNNQLKSRMQYYKAFHIRDVLIRRTKLTRKIFNNILTSKENQNKLNSKSKTGLDKQTLNQALRKLNSTKLTESNLIETNGLNMILTLLPVLPPVLRPVLKLSGQFTISDLNRLYQRIIYRNERLKKFLKDPALSTSFEMKYAQRLLQEAVDNLIQNGKSGVVSEKDSRGRLLKSLSDILKGKQGRFRQYLLGKRVDYSGRSVIVVGPRLKLHECGIPKEMALVLYSPFLIKRILNEKLADTYLAAKKLIQTNPLLVSQLLREIMKSCPVLLNRAPTLHRLGFQAFQPKLVDGKAILLHPLVCPAFNADFDGDQMAVHVPITFEARAEAWKLMLARNNLLSPATGEPLILPSQDMVLGCYYLTTNCAEKSIKFKKGSGMFFHSINDVLKAYNLNKIHMHAVIWVNINAEIESGNMLEQPLEIRLPLRKIKLTTNQTQSLSVSSTSVKVSAIESKVDSNHTDRNGEINQNSNTHYIEIYSKYHNILNKKGIMANQIIRTTPGKIVFNCIIKNALEKRPSLLSKYNAQTGFLKTQLINTLQLTAT